MQKGITFEQCSGPFLNTDSLLCFAYVSPLSAFGTFLDVSSIISL